MSILNSSGTMAGDSNHLNWLNVVFGLGFIAFDALLSLGFGLGIGGSLIVAAGRCVLQLTIMGLVLDKVFAADNIWAVAGIAILLNVLGAIEAVYNKSKRRFSNMFPFVLLSIMSASLPISILGSQFAMAQRPFWQPDQYVPILGMLLGNAISSVGVGMNFVQKEFAESRDKIETYLAMGATRFEACMPIGKEALKLAMLPTVNQMSVIGLISIPGMMTGAIVGGKSVEQAARLQMIIMFMISASSALSVLCSMGFALMVLVDGKHRIRSDRLDSRKPAFYRARDSVADKAWTRLKRATLPVWRTISCAGKRDKGSDGEREALLGGRGR